MILKVSPTDIFLYERNFFQYFNEGIFAGIILVFIKAVCVWYAQVIFCSVLTNLCKLSATWYTRACYEIGQHRDKKILNVIFFYSLRFINVWMDKKSILYFYPMNRQSSMGFQRYTNLGKISRTYTSCNKFLILLTRLNVLIPNQVITIKHKTLKLPLTKFNSIVYFPFFQIRHILCQKLKMYVQQIFEKKS